MVRINRGRGGKFRPPAFSLSAWLRAATLSFTGEQESDEDGREGKKNSSGGVRRMVP